MIIQTAPAGQPRLAVMMYEHTALSHQFARAFGNDRFQGPEPNDLMFHVVLHHDAGWAEFDRDPVTDQATGLPYNLVETPAEYITVTSRGSPEFNQRQHPFCGLMSSMHSWGLYNGRYGLSSMVLIDKIPPHDRPLVQRMLDDEIDRQKRLKAELAQDPKTSAWIEDKRLFQSYKQLQFFDTLALYFNRTRPRERGEVKFEHVPLSGEQDTTIAVRPRGPGVYELSPNPFAAHSAEYAFAGRPIEPGLDRYGVRATVALNSDICVHHPEIIEEGEKRRWEWMGHNQSNSRRLNEVPAEEEPAIIRDTLDTIASVSGTRPVGWLGAGLQETWNTLDLLAEAGCEYVADWGPNDDQPYTMTLGEDKTITSLPYSYNINDKQAFESANMTPADFQDAI